MTAAVALLLAATAAAVPMAQIDAWRSQGREAFDDHRYPQAMDLFLKVLEAAPTDFEAKKYLLDISRAAAEWEKKGRLEPGEIERSRALAFKNMSGHRRELYRTNLQLELVRQALGSKSDRALVNSSIQLTRASDDEFQDVHFAAQAKLYLEQLQERLRASLREGQLKDPKDLHAARGFLYYQRGLLEPALDEWQEALSLDPYDDALQAQVGWLGAKIKKVRERERLDALAREGQKWYRMELYDRAMRSWSQMLELDPKSEQAITGLAEAQRRMKAKLLEARLAQARRLGASGGPLEALRRWVAVLEVDPVNPEALAAIKNWRQAQPATPAPAAPAPRPAPVARRGPRPQEAEEQYAVGMAYYSQGELALALQAMKRSLELDPSLAKAKIAVERIQAETGQ